MVENETVQGGLSAEVANDLRELCVKHPLSIYKIALLSGASRPTVQRMFDRKVVRLETIYKLKKWIDAVNSGECEL